MARIKQLLVFWLVQITALIYLYMGDINWIMVLIGWFIFCGLGSAVMMHRGLAHKTFNVPLWGKILACLSVQGSPMWWVATHREHHAHTDVPGDPHSPLHGLMYAYIGWIHKSRPVNPRLLRDYLRDKEMHWVEKNYVWIVLLAYVILPWDLWLIPAAWSFHQEAIVNVLCHPVKNRPILGLFTWGQAIHKNHHDKQNTFLFGRWDPCILWTRLISLYGNKRSLNY